MRIYDAVDYFVDQVNTSTAAWAAESAEAYRRRARDDAQSVQASGKIANGMSTATTIVGAMVGVMRNTGSTGSTLTGDDPEPTHIDLPL